MTHLIKSFDSPLTSAPPDSLTPLTKAARVSCFDQSVGRFELRRRRGRVPAAYRGSRNRR